MAQQLSLYYFKKSIQKYGAEYVKELVKQLILADKKATGELMKSIDYRLIEASNEILVRILAAPYLINVDEGRKPGRMPPVASIIKWAKVRGITPNKRKGYKTMNDVGWAIAKKIEKSGIKPTNVIDKTNKAILSNQKLLFDIGNAGLLDINELINKTFYDVSSTFGQLVKK